MQHQGINVLAEQTAVTLQSKAWSGKSVYFQPRKEDILMAKRDDVETTADTRVFFEVFLVE
jgi:hypothetical protein